MVADRIRTLRALGVLADDYRLTAKGPALVNRHVPCGTGFVAALDCSSCGDRLARKGVFPTS